MRPAIPLAEFTGLRLRLADSRADILTDVGGGTREGGFKDLRPPPCRAGARGFVVR
jgi:hypothetical protein